MRVTRTPLGRSDGRHPLRTSLASVTTRGRGRQFVVLGPLTVFVLLHISACVAIVADSRVDGGRVPPVSFSILELINHERADELREVLTTTGLLAVRLHDGDSDDDYAHNRQVALDGLCSCYDHPSFLQIGQGTKDQVQQQQIRSMVLPDQRTVRTTVATGMVGMNHPLPLPEGLPELCGTDVTDAMEGLRDQLAEVSHAFVRALDHAIGRGGDGTIVANAAGAGTTPLLKDKHGKSYHSVQSIVQAANHLEHFHVYTSNEAGIKNGNADEKDTAASSSVAWDWHTDAGLFLVFVPAWNCHDSGNGDDDLHQDNSFWYRDSSGQPIQATFNGQDTAIIMLGQGAQDWLDLSTTGSGSNQPSLKATVHSVQWEDQKDDKQRQQQQHQQRRSWYGMMTLVPETAIIYGSKTLKEVRSSLSLSNSIENATSNFNDDDGAAVLSLGCGIVPASQFSMGETLKDEKPYLSINTRRRIQHQDPSACNNVTNFFCWMQCLEVPNADNAQTYVNDGYSLYCLDPAILASSTSDQVRKAAEPCENGWVHDADCLGSWQPTAPGVPAAALNVTADGEYADDAFCYGGTSMYMDGFHWVQSTTCVIYLFQSWVLNSGGKYAAATIGTFLVAIGLEKIIQQRRRIMARMESARPRTRLLATAVFYGTQLTLGYLLMLVVMIYSGVLLMATVLGLVAGHILFNAKDAFFPLKDSPATTVSKGEVEGGDDAVFVSEGTAARTNERSSAEGDSRVSDLPACCCDSSRLESMAEMVSTGEKDTSNYGSLNASKKTPSTKILTSANTGYVVPEGITPCCQNIL